MNQQQINSKNHKVVFLDRDGVINHNIDEHVKSLEEFYFYEYSIKSIRKLYEAGFLIFIISNQRIIQDQNIPEKNIISIFEYLCKTTDINGGKITNYYYCPHSKYPEQNGKIPCSCRKPKPGLLLKAANDYNLNLENCYLIGDQISDIQAGKAVQCYSILVKTGLGQKHIERKSTWPVQPDEILNDLQEATNFIIKREELFNSNLNIISNLTGT